jgi:hypothetical protein
MKTSLTDTIRTERFLKGELSGAEHAAFESRLSDDTALRTNTIFHRMVHRLVLLYGRKKLKSEMEGIHQRLVDDPARVKYREAILGIFNS